MLKSKYQQQLFLLQFIKLRNAPENTFPNLLFISLIHIKKSND